MGEVEETQDKKTIDYFKWALGIMITLVLGLSVMNANILIGIRATQSSQAAEISRIVAIQNINTSAIANLNARVTNIESDKIAEIKQWSLDTFVQKK